MEAQGDVLWEVAPGAHEDVPLFETTSAYLHKNSLTFLGGGHGWSVTFVVGFFSFFWQHTCGILMCRSKVSQRKGGWFWNQRKKVLSFCSHLQRLA